MSCTYGQLRSISLSNQVLSYKFLAKSVSKKRDNCLWLLPHITLIRLLKVAIDSNNSGWFAAAVLSIIRVVGFYIMIFTSGSCFSLLFFFSSVTIYLNARFCMAAVVQKTTRALSITSFVNFLQSRLYLFSVFLFPKPSSRSRVFRLFVKLFYAAVFFLTMLRCRLSMCYGLVNSRVASRRCALTCASE